MDSSYVSGDTYSNSCPASTHVSCIVLLSIHDLPQTLRFNETISPKAVILYFPVFSLALPHPAERCLECSCSFLRATTHLYLNPRLGFCMSEHFPCSEYFLLFTWEIAVSCLSLVHWT